MDKLDTFIVRYGSEGTNLILENAFTQLAKAASELEKIGNGSGKLLALADECETAAKRLDKLRIALVKGIEERLKLT